MKRRLLQLQRPLFIIEIVNGKLGRITGTPKNSFLIDCAEIIQRNGIQFGLVFAFPAVTGKPVLQATFEIETGVLQQLRNTWNFYC